MLAALLTLGAGLILSAPALAAQDLLSGGTVTLELKSTKKLKLKPRTLSLAISKGNVDPVTGAGTIEAAGTLRAKSGKRNKKSGKRKAKKSGKRNKKSGKGKAKVRILSLTIGGSGSPGQIDAKVDKKRVNAFATLSGGVTTRQGFGASLSGIEAKLGSKGAKALNKAFSKTKKKKRKKKRGGASAARKKRSKKGKVKAGLPLGTVSATTIPKTVEVLPGGELTLHTNTALITKLLNHCIDAIGVLGGGAGVYPVAPATQNPLPPVGDGAFRFPVTGGALAPDLTDGKVITGGGQGLTKNVGTVIPPLVGPECDLPPAVGTTVLNVNLTPDFLINGIYGDAVLPGGVTLAGSVGEINWGTGTRSLDPAAKKFTATGATVTLNAIAAMTLNNIFPNRSGDPSQDFSSADTLGTIDLTATLR